MKNIGKAIVAGLIGTAVMTGFMYAAPMMGMPPMNIPKMLSMFMGFSIMVGWVMHFAIGSMLAIIYSFVSDYLPFDGWLNGAVYGIFPWLMAQVVVMPMMHMGLFSGSMVMAGGSLVGHLVYGAVVGGVYRKCASCSCAVGGGE